MPDPTLRWSSRRSSPLAPQPIPGPAPAATTSTPIPTPTPTPTPSPIPDPGPGPIPNPSRLPRATSPASVPAVVVRPKALSRMNKTELKAELATYGRDE